MTAPVAAKRKHTLQSPLVRWLGLPRHPLFTHDLHDIRGIKSERGLARYLAWSVLITLLLGIVSYVGLMLYTGTPMEAGAIVLYVILVAGLITYAFEWVHTLAAIFFSSGLIITERDADRIDLLRLAAQEEVIIRAKHATAMTKTWRFTAIFLTARLAVILSGLGFIAVVPITEWSEVQRVVGLNPTLSTQLIVLWLPTLLITVVWFMVKPVMRV
ncbi:MAG: hypothetical protein AAF125_19360 [Chloroflexota bacterium]